MSSRSSQSSFESPPSRLRKIITNIVLKYKRVQNTKNLKKPGVEPSYEDINLLVAGFV